MLLRVHQLNNNEEMNLGTCRLNLGKLKDTFVLPESIMHQTLTTAG
jgi:hypothetical protein